MSKEVGYRTIGRAEAERILFNANDIPILISFTTEWTGNGLMMDNFYEELAKEYHNTVYFYRIDIEQQQNYADKFGVSKVPTALIFHRNEIIDHFKGAISKHDIEKKLDAIIR